MDLEDEWGESDKSRRRKSEGKFYNFLNRSAASLSRSKSQDGKSRRVKDKEVDDLASPQVSHMPVASHLPVHSGLSEKLPRNAIHTRPTYAYQTAGLVTAPTESTKLPQSPPRSPRSKARQTVTTATSSKSIGISLNASNRIPSLARPSSSPTRREAFNSGLLLNRPVARPITPSSSSSTGRKVLGILLSSSSSRKAAPVDDGRDKRYTHQPRSGSGSSHEPLLPTQSRASDRGHFALPAYSSTTPTTPSRSDKPRTVSESQTRPPQALPITPTRSQRTTVNLDEKTSSNVTQRKSTPKLDFWRSATPRTVTYAQDVNTKEKGKQRTGAGSPSNVERHPASPTTLHSPQAQKPVTFLPRLPRLQTTPPTPQKREKKQEPSSVRVDSFMSDSLPIPQPPEADRLTPPTADFTPISRHPAFVKPGSSQAQPPVLSCAPGLGIQRSKSAPGGSRGRTSPCLRIPSPKFLSKDKDRDMREKRKVTPENVGSPILRDTRQLAGEKPKAAHAVQNHGVRRTTLPSFDFERPGSRNSSKSGQSDSRGARSDEEKENEKSLPPRPSIASKVPTMKREVVLKRTESPKIKHKAPSPVPPLPTSLPKGRSPPPPRTRSPLATTPTTAHSQSTHGDVDDSALPRLSSSLGRRSNTRTHRTHASHPSFSFEPAASTSSNPVRSRTTSGTKTATPRHSDQFVDTHTGLMWAPMKIKEKTIPEEERDVQYYSLASPPRGVPVQMTAISPHELREATEVIAQFKNALNDAGFATLQKYVCRYDTQVIPLEGSAGLLVRVQRLLETSAPRIDDRRKRELLDNFIRVVRQGS